ncbi:glycosyltransferase [Altererythrobacter sp. CC-YST694]|uniref:glycosyltransferase n=1 Tax=Altererythrobacter sp. CC-YST694 TaxID=2755038 RepID=UPI001D020DDC|nr:glycosyltransferase [Altererythrobacter sp. CC-YST694]MCB5424785.1 glycosyltransferase [Altererythrobacter sp. CC-YST694]
MAGDGGNAGPQIVTAARRVLSIATLYPNSHTPRFGTFVARQMEALAARGDWEVTLINPIGIPPIAFGPYRALAHAVESGRENGVDVHRIRFPLLPRFGARLNPSAIGRAILPLARRLHAERPFDLVDAQFFFPDGPAAARIARALGLPLSIKARGADIHYWGSLPWARRAIVDAGKQATGMLAVSQALAADMAALGLPQGSITVHYTGLDRARFHPLGRANARQYLAGMPGLHIHPGHRLLAAVGALIPRKGQSLVIEALARIEGTDLVLVGAGPDEASLRRLSSSLGVADRVHFLGNIDHDLLPVVLSAADAMVLPSSSEGLANAWIEALACGTPLVICDAGGAREVVRDASAGFVVERDVAEIAQAISALLKDAPSPDAVAANADRFSWEANARALADYYERLLTA